MDDPGDSNRCRLVGDYILGPKIGSGSFAVVWRSRHRQLGVEVAVKEIDKKQLNNKVNDNIFKEITILSNIRHPNIIRLHEAIETEDKIYLILEYCNGGDLSAYIHRHGRVSEAIARHFMTQLASGLQVLRENNLIHRDLKPQNLLLSTHEEFPVLKIGDFGFARYLTQGWADTLCGSPLYMAPEIFQNQKYDAKADLWSVGAILFQLVTGKPPFDGNSQFQLFQNVLISNELRFPQGALEELHPDCVDLCRNLLRQNPVERLTFEEFFNHKFMEKPRLTVDVEHSSLLPEIRPLVEQFERLSDDGLHFASGKRPQFHLFNSSTRNPKLTSCSAAHDESKKVLPKIDHGSKMPSSSIIEISHKFMLNATSDSQKKSIDISDSSVLISRKTGSMDQQLFNALKAADSLEYIEKEYVLVNAHFASMETLPSSLEASMQDHCVAGVSNFLPNKIGSDVVVAMQTGVLSAHSFCGTESLGTHVSAPLAAPQLSTELGDEQVLSLLHPSTRLRLLHQYVHALSELAQEKLNAGMVLESFSVELVALAVWREAFHVCRSWVASTVGGDFPGVVSDNECTPDQEGACLSLKFEEGIDFSRPASVSLWAERGFIVAFDRAEKISNHIRDMDGTAEMPDAMEIIFQTALAAGRSGAVVELMGNKSSAAMWYSKATVLLSFIVGEATTLPLNPPFSLSVADQQRIRRYIINLKAHKTHSQMPQSSKEHSLDSSRV